MAASTHLGRRAALSALAAWCGGAWCAAAATFAAAPASAAAGRADVEVKRSALGVTFAFRLKHAPFPDGIKAYRDNTVLVFVPRHFRLPKSRRPDVVVHFHGHLGTARRAIVNHQLREQLVDSKQNAILVVPQGPRNARDSSGGKLERRGGLRRLLDEVVRKLRGARSGRQLGKASLAGAKGVGMVCLSAHSGGYRVTAACLRRGGVNVNEVYLFDALYGEVETFHRWVLARRGRRGRDRHKLVCMYAGGKPRAHSRALALRLENAGARVFHERRPGTLTRAQLVQGEAVFIAVPVAHGQVTFRHNALRDCLFASGLKRHLDSEWFERKNQPRRIEQRAG
jgi:hypothetical protein